MDQMDRPLRRRPEADQSLRADRMTLTFWREAAPAYGSLRWAGFTLGFGLGGLIDGIVLHQILQWHHMISSRVPITNLENLQVNTLADGIFNASMWLISLLGVILLWNAVKTGARIPLSSRHLLGWAFLGWGVFNVVDSITFHALLGLHHIRQVPDFLVYDYGFFFLGLAFIALGLALTRARKPMLGG